MIEDVLNGKRWYCEQGDALEFLRRLPDNCVDLIFTSPPYTDARTYGISAARRSEEWVKWLRPIVVEGCRVSRGLVFLNISDRVRKFRYQNGPEWLHADLTRLDGLHAVRPYIWVKSGPGFDDPGNSTPGSGGPHYHRNDYEPIYGYAEATKLPPPFSDNTAFGLPPEWGPGGPTSHRDQNGKRKAHTKYEVAGLVQHYIPPALSNPGNVIRVRQTWPYTACSYFSEVIAYGYACQASPTETLQSMQQAARSGSIFEWCAGIRARLHASSLLRPDVHGAWRADAGTTALRFLRNRVSSEEFQQAILWMGMQGCRPGEAGCRNGVGERLQGSGQEDNREGVLPTVRDNGKTSSPPSRRESAEQRAEQSRGVMRDMPRGTPQSADSTNSELFRLWQTDGQELQAIWDAVRQTLSAMQEARVTIPCESPSVWGGGWDRNHNHPASNVIRARVGGGHLGHDLAHESEAPMPLAVAERFVRWYCPPDGVVLDPFAGSGTTCHAAFIHGRRFVGCDLRESQVELLGRRMASVVNPPVPDIGFQRTILELLDTPPAGTDTDTRAGTGLSEVLP